MKSKLLYLTIVLVLVFGSITFSDTGWPMLQLNKVLADTMIVNDTFDDKAIGYVPTTADGWTADLAAAAPGDSASVQDDPIHPGNKALKLIKKDTVDSSSFIFFRKFSNAEYGKILCSFKMLVENHTQYLIRGGSAYGYKYNGTSKTYPYAVPSLSSGNNFLFKAEDGANDTYIAISNLNADHTKWYSLQYVVDTDTDTYDLYLDGTLIKKNALFSVAGSIGNNGVVAMDIDGIADMEFGAKCTAKGGGDSIYWFDDIMVRKLTPLEVLTASPAQLSTDINVNPTASLSFNLPVSSSSVTKQNIKVFKDETELSIDNYNVNLVSSETEPGLINVTFNKPLDYKSLYIITVSKSLTSIGDIPIGMTSDYSLSFTTRPPSFDVQYVRLTDAANNDVMSIADVKGKMMNVNLSMKNVDLPAEQSYAVIMAIVDGNGMMHKCKCFSDVMAIGNETVLNALFDVPQNADDGYKLQCFVWNKFSEMKKLYPYIVKP